MRHAGDIKPGVGGVDGGERIGNMMARLHPARIMRRYNADLRMCHVGGMDVDVVFMFVENVIMPATCSQLQRAILVLREKEPTVDRGVEVLG